MDELTHTGNLVDLDVETNVAEFLEEEEIGRAHV